MFLDGDELAGCDWLLGVPEGDGIGGGFWAGDWYSELWVC